jgi:hypothetical protein
MTETPLENLRVTILADTSEERVRRFDPETGDAYLADPTTWRRDDPNTWQHTPYPFAGVRLENKPTRTRISTNYAVRGKVEGWITMDGIEMVHRPGGPPHNRWQQTHTFTHTKTITFHTVDGDIVYRVVHQPDKYAVTHRETVNEVKGIVVEHIDPQKKFTDEIYEAGNTRVDFFYELELVNA